MEADDGNQTDDSAETEDGHENVALAFGEVEGFCDGEGEEGGCYVGCYVEGGVEEPSCFFFLVSPSVYTLGLTMSGSEGWWEKE